MTFIPAELACQNRGYAFQTTVNFGNASIWITKKKKKKIIFDNILGIAAVSFRKYKWTS